MTLINHKVNDLVRYDASRLTDHDIYLFKEGNHFRLYKCLGAHVMNVEGISGVHFAVWAPNAEKVSVTGDFNGWDGESHQLMSRRDASGIWEGFVPGLKKGDIYKYHIASRWNGYNVEKGDPFAFLWEVAPRSGSVVWDLEYEWSDKEWMAKRHKANALN